MDLFFMIWFGLSIILFFAGIFVYRKGVDRQVIGVVSGAVGIDGSVSQAVQENEVAKLKESYQESLSKIEQSIQDKDIQIHQLEENLNLKDAQLHELLAVKEDSINLLRVEQEKLMRQLAEEKKYSAQSVDDYRSQIRSLDQMLSQLKSDHQVALQEKEILLSNLAEEGDIVVGQRDDLSRKVSSLELKSQEAFRIIETLKNNSVESLSVGGEDLKISLQKSVALIKELKTDNDQLHLISKSLKEKLLDTESANQGLEEKGQQLQYELVKVRAQLLGLERICDDLKKKMEQSISLRKS